MDSTRQPRYLHVANGTSTTSLIDQAGIPGAFSIWADPLHDGPVPHLEDDELVELRMNYLAGRGAAVDPVNDLRRWRAVIAARDTFDELVLWYEHDLFDQLNLIQLLTWIRSRVPDGPRVSLICIDRYPGRLNFKGLGELTPGEIASLFGMRAPVTDAQFALAERAWDAFREPTPQGLAALCREETSALPYLASALTRFLEEFPWTSDGLSRSERRLLELSAKGTTVSEAFQKMHEGETAYYITDSSLAALASELSGTTPPLLDVDTHGSGDRMIFRGSIALSPAGRDVLDGRADRIALCGIDRWMGGVHVRAGRIWRWNDPDVMPDWTASSAPAPRR